MGKGELTGLRGSFSPKVCSMRSVTLVYCSVRELRDNQVSHSGKLQHCMGLYDRELYFLYLYFCDLYFNNDGDKNNQESSAFASQQAIFRSPQQKKKRWGKK